MNKIHEIKEKYGQQAESIIANGLCLEHKNNKYRCPNRPAHRRGDKIPSMSWDKNALQMYCFACGMKLDIYGYYREHLNYSHDEVVSELLGDISNSRFESERSNFNKELQKIKELDNKCIEYIKSRGITEETIKYFGLKMFNNAIAFPYAKYEAIIGYKIRKAEKNPASPKMYSMKGSKPFLFNFNNLGEDKSELVICEGEFDCMILHQCGFENVVSVGAGANSLSTLINQAKEYFDAYDNLIIVSDNDDAGSKMDDIFSTEFGYKAKLIDKSLYTQNDVNAEYFKNGKQAIIELINSARLKIEGIRDLDLQPYEGLEQKKGSFIPTGISKLDWCTNDLAPGCVSVIVGRTNAGKTTFTKQIISNAIEHGNKVFCVSGEGDVNIFINEIYKNVIGNNAKYYDVIKYHKRMYKEPKKEVLEKLKQWHKGKLKIFSKGDSKLKTMDELFDTLSREIKHGKHNLVVLDNLMSLLTVSGYESKNDAQGEFVQRCCDISKAYNVHIIIVVHPRKPAYGEKARDINIENISGSMDIGNKADNIIVVERNYAKDDENPYDGSIRLIKNRYLSDLCKVHTVLDEDSGLLLGIDEKTNVAEGYSFSLFGKKDNNDIDLDCPF